MALKDQIAGAVSDAIKPDELLKSITDAQENGDPEGIINAPTNPQVPMCAAEAIVAQVIALNKDEIDASNNAIVDNLNAYLEDMDEMLAGITGFESEITNQISSIVGSMTGALDFTNFKLNIFGCELEPTLAESDTYTFCSGGDQVSPPQKPSNASIDKGVKEASEISDVPPPTPYLEPNKSQSTVELDQNTKDVLAREDAAVEKALQDSRNNVPVQEGDLNIL